MSQSKEKGYTMAMASNGVEPKKTPIGETVGETGLATNAQSVSGRRGAESNNPYVTDLLNLQPSDAATAGINNSQSAIDTDTLGEIAKTFRRVTERNPTWTFGHLTSKFDVFFIAVPTDAYVFVDYVVVFKKGNAETISSIIARSRLESALQNNRGRIHPEDILDEVANNTNSSYTNDSVVIEMITTELLKMNIHARIVPGTGSIIKYDSRTMSDESLSQTIAVKLIEGKTNLLQAHTSMAYLPLSRPLQALAGYGELKYSATIAPVQDGVVNTKSGDDIGADFCMSITLIPNEGYKAATERHLQTRVNEEMLAGGKLTADVYMTIDFAFLSEQSDKRDGPNEQFVDPIFTIKYISGDESLLTPDIVDYLVSEQLSYITTIGAILDDDDLIDRKLKYVFEEIDGHMSESQRILRFIDNAMVKKPGFRSDSLDFKSVNTKDKETFAAYLMLKVFGHTTGGRCSPILEWALPISDEIGKNMAVLYSAKQYPSNFFSSSDFAKQLVDRYASQLANVLLRKSIPAGTSETNIRQILSTEGRALADEISVDLVRVLQAYDQSNGQLAGQFPNIKLIGGHEFIADISNTAFADMIGEPVNNYWTSDKINAFVATNAHDYEAHVNLIAIQPTVERTEFIRKWFVEKFSIMAVNEITSSLSKYLDSNMSKRVIRTSMKGSGGYGSHISRVGTGGYGRGIRGTGHRRVW